MVDRVDDVAALCCVHGMHLLGVAWLPFRARGDSVTALTWAKKGTVRSDIATRAAMLWGQYLVVKGTDLTGVDHLPKKVNTRTDRLSRPMWTWDLVLENDRENNGGKLPADLRFLDLNCQKLLDIRKPSVPLDTDEEFCAFFKSGFDFLKTSPNTRGLQETLAPHRRQPSCVPMQ
jgi:hypothetical protein